MPDDADKPADPAAAMPGPDSPLNAPFVNARLFPDPVTGEATRRQLEYSRTPAGMEPLVAAARAKLVAYACGRDPRDGGAIHILMIAPDVEPGEDDDEDDGDLTPLALSDADMRRLAHAAEEGRRIRAETEAIRAAGKQGAN